MNIIKEEIVMALSQTQKWAYLDKAIEIAKASAGSGANLCCSSVTLADIIKDTYDKMVEIAEQG